MSVVRLRDDEDSDVAPGEGGSECNQGVNG